MKLTRMKIKMRKKKKRRDKLLKKSYTIRKTCNYLIVLVFCFSSHVNEPVLHLASLTQSSQFIWQFFLGKYISLVDKVANGCHIPLTADDQTNTDHLGRNWYLTSIHEDQILERLLKYHEKMGNLETSSHPWKSVAVSPDRKTKFVLFVWDRFCVLKIIWLFLVEWCLKPVFFFFGFCLLVCFCHLFGWKWSRQDHFRFTSFCKKQEHSVWMGWRQMNLGQLRFFVINIPRDCPSISEYHVLFMVLDNCCPFSVKVLLDSW